MVFIPLATALLGRPQTFTICAFLQVISNFKFICGRHMFQTNNNTLLFYSHTPKTDTSAVCNPERWCSSKHSAPRATERVPQMDVSALRWACSPESLTMRPFQVAAEDSEIPFPDGHFHEKIKIILGEDVMTLWNVGSSPRELPITPTGKMLRVTSGLCAHP